MITLLKNRLVFAAVCLIFVAATFANWQLPAESDVVASPGAVHGSINSARS